MKVKIKKLVEEAVIPTYAKPGDAGLDLTAVSCKLLGDALKPYSEYGTGLSIEIPEGYVGLLFPRSSISNTPLSLANAVGVLDSGYRGEVSFRFKTDGIAAALCMKDDLEVEEIEEGMKEMYQDKWQGYQVGDKIGQLIILPYPQIEFEEVQELAESERGTGGFGSTGTK